MSEVTQMLDAASRGDRMAAEKLLPLVYEELRKLAAARLAREAAGDTLQPTALVHEAWLRVSGGEQQVFDGKAHFFAAAAEAMRRILIDRARRKKAIRHGGALEKVPWDGNDGFDIPSPLPDDQALELDEELDAFAEKHPKAAQIIKLRYFAGLTLKEAALVLGISPDTAKDYSAFARAWLFKEISAKEKFSRS